MRFCSPSCGQLAARKRDGIEVDSIRFTLDAHGYYSSSDGKGIKLHRYLWEKRFGPIPPGYVVHHKNEIKTDNQLSNLSLIQWGIHTAEHSKERWSSGKKMGKAPSKPCAEMACERISKARGLCTKHYQKLMAKERGKWL